MGLVEFLIPVGLFVAFVAYGFHRNYKRKKKLLVETDHYDTDMGYSEVIGYDLTEIDDATIEEADVDVDPGDIGADGGIDGGGGGGGFDGGGGGE